jgi:hypothetical protein
MPSGSVKNTSRGAGATVFVLLAALLPSCNSSTGLAALPVLVAPVDGVRVTSDSPTFSIRNAQGYDGKGATYTFRAAVAKTDQELATVTVAAGSGTTTARFERPLPRGVLLAWRVTGRTAGSSEVVSDRATFRLPAVTCLSGQSPWAKSIVDWWLPSCSLTHNAYNNPQETLGEPNASQDAQGGPYHGFMSLGDGGHVTVDMGGCAVDGEGDDVRVYQSVSQEPVTLYASGTAEGPYVLIESRKFCGVRMPGVFSRVCSFDLGQAGLEEARYFRVEDGELFPCPGGTDSEGADIDAVEILHAKP